MRIKNEHGDRPEIRDTAIRLLSCPPRDVVLRDLVQSLSATAADLDRALVSQKAERVAEAMERLPMLRRKLEGLEA